MLNCEENVWPWIKHAKEVWSTDGNCKGHCDHSREVSKDGYFSATETVRAIFQASVGNYELTKKGQHTTAHPFKGATLRPKWFGTAIVQMILDFACAEGTIHLNRMVSILLTTPGR